METGELKVLDDYKEPETKPSWASISPDGEKIVFARDFNLYWMDKENYQKAQEDEEDESIEEHQLTTDGEELTNVMVVPSAGGVGGPYSDAHYQSLTVGPGGILYMVYNWHHWLLYGEWDTYIRESIHYTSSNDGGLIWEYGGVIATQLSSTPWDITLTSALATSSHLHVLYQTGEIGRTYHARITYKEWSIVPDTRDTHVDTHAVLVHDPEFDDLYIVGQTKHESPHYWVSEDEGGEWFPGPEMATPTLPGSFWFYQSGIPSVVEGHFILTVLTDHDAGDVWFVRFDLRGNTGE